MREHDGSIDRLKREFRDIPEPEIRQTYEQVLSRYTGARIQAYVAILAYKEARDALRTQKKRQKTNGPNTG